jgi:adenylate cyclase
LGIFIGLVGLIVLLVPFGLVLEEDVGLTLLFKMRGARESPSDVVVVGMDKDSADRMGLPHDFEKWPRSLHAELVEKLVKVGSSVIAFDIFFGEPRPQKEDKIFADSILKARSVVLVESLEREKTPLTDRRGLPAGDINIEKLVPPVSPLAASAVALAPFPLPKVPVKVSQYWTFKTSAGDTPTLPVIAFQVFAREIYGEFISLLELFNPPLLDNLPRTGDELLTAQRVVSTVQTLRSIFQSDRTIAGKMLNELQSRRSLSVSERKMHILRMLIMLYQSPDNQYLNFYGPPQTITTIPYYKVLEIGSKPDVSEEQLELKGKAVFVGHSERLQPEQKDGFYTVFSQPNGLDINGVEIAATAFANVLEDMPVKPHIFRSYLLITLFWGVLIGTLSRLFAAVISAVCVAGVSALYFLAVVKQFTSAGTWYPLVVPLFLQVPMAYFVAVAWKYFDTSKERKNIRSAFKLYLPDEIIDQLIRDIGDVRTSSRFVFGTCLFTDAEEYTARAEDMDPNELRSLINRYYELIFEPVKRHGGVVSNLIGDSMLALWVTVSPHDTSREKACLAALDIEKALLKYRESSDDMSLLTRVSLHSGNFLLSNIGAIDHYEYRPVGDMINTTTRIDGLNKYLGTKMLVSEEVIKGLDGFFTREIGTFLFAGKSRPLVLHELICRNEESSQQQEELRECFANSLDAFRRKSWTEASEKFAEIIERFGDDGPSKFYLNLCEKYRTEPPCESWDGTVQLDRK